MKACDNYPGLGNIFIPLTIQCFNFNKDDIKINFRNLHKIHPLTEVVFKEFISKIMNNITA